MVLVVMGFVTMQIAVALPDDFARQVSSQWGSLERVFLEFLVIKAYQDELITTGKVRELLGLATRLEADAWLKMRGIELNYAQRELEADRETHAQLRREGKLSVGI